MKPQHTNCPIAKRYIISLFLVLTAPTVWAQISSTTGGNPVAGAVTTHTYIYNTNTLSSPSWQVSGGTEVSRTMSPANYQITITWGEGPSGGMVLLDGSTPAASLSITVLERPSTSPATAVSTTSFTANWGTVANAAVYQLDVSTNSNFDSFVVGYENKPVIGIAHSVGGLQPNSPYYYRVRAVHMTGVTSASSSYITVSTAPPAPSVLPATGITSTGFTANWSATTGATGYRLDVSTYPNFSSFLDGHNNLTVSGTSQVITDLSMDKSYYYRVRAVNSTGTSVNSNSQILDLDHSYIRKTSVMLAGLTTPAAVESATLNQKVTTYEFFDGLGRPDQVIIKQGSPAQKDIIQAMAYDEFGREPKKYLPYVDAASGWYKKNALKDPTTQSYNSGQQFQFYQTGGEIASDPAPFAESRFEHSPLNRILEQGAPGTEFQPDASDTYTSADHTVKKAYEVVSSTTEVLKWIYEYPGASPHLMGLVNASTGTTPIYHIANTIYRNRTKDENGNEVLEYSDTRGKLILKRVQAVSSPSPINDTNYASTYYIYDDFDRLTCVIPPEAVRLITLPASVYFGKTDTEKDNFLKRWAFRYRYDARGRMIQKQVPGAEPVYMVYDSRDRLVMTQDGNQRAATTKSWTFTKYDILNRPIATGIKDTTVALTQAQMQGVVDTYYNEIVSAGKTYRAFGETFVGYSGTNVHGYSNNSFPKTTSPGTLDVYRYVTITYYDSYDFRNGWVGANREDYRYVDEGLSGALNGITYHQPDTLNPFVTGQVTGTKTRALDGYVYLKSINYYDDKYRVVQTISDNYQLDIDRVSNLYDFTGKVLKTKSTHKKSNVSWKDIGGATVTGNKLTKVEPTNAWGDGGACSIAQLPAGQDGWLEVVVSEIGTNRLIGLGSSNPDLNFNSIKYGLYITGNNLRLYESGSVVKIINNVLSSGDILRIERTGTTVKFYRGSTLERVSPVASNTVLMVDASLHSLGGTLVARSSFSTSTHSIVRTYEYDHAGRLLKTFHKLDNNDEVLLSQNEYNELGQLIDKDLHSVSGSQPKQSVDHRYNIRGWLTSINNASLSSDDTNDDSGDLFGMNLGYNANVLSGGTAQYNGNIASMTWSKNLGLSTINQNGYSYTYDPMNRIKGAAFKEKSTAWNVPTASAFSESGYDYDLNGNIKSLIRYDQRGSTTAMDNLTYDYGTGTTQSNKLLKVTDAGDDTKGFKEFNGAGDDYVYDANGNLLWDKNKGGEEVLTNGDFDNGSSSWAINDPGSKLTFSSGSLNIVSGASASRIVQTGVVRQNYQYVVMIDIERTSGSAVTITTGNAAVSVSTTGTFAFNVAPTINGNFFIDIPANFVGKISRVQLKGLVVISYNFMNLVHSATAANDKQVLYIYDGTGRKLNQTVLDITGQSKTEKSSDYAGEYFYENDTLKFIHTEDGRIIMTGAQPEYQYHLKDHLGNVRLTFTTKDEVDESLATLETANASQEQSEFLYYDEAVKINYDKFDHTNEGGTYYATRLTGGSTNEIYGLTKTLSVIPGDKISIEVYAKYLDPNSSNWNTALTNFIGSITGGTAPAGTFVDGGSSGSIGGATYPINGIDHSSETGTEPQAYLNYIVYNKDMTAVLDLGFKRITTNSREYGQDAAHDKLSFEGAEEVLIKEPGYVYIYLSNENETPVEVFFDDFKVEHKKSPVVQVDDYYPFGLSFNSYQRENSVPNKTLFQETELQDELNLNWYDFVGRLYDPFICRTPTLDPHAEYYEDVSPYSFLDNNPINTIDPTGMDATGLNENGRSGLAICPTCPNTPEFKPYIDDPNNTYVYDEKSKEVSLLLPEVEVRDAEPPSFASVAIPILMSRPETSGLLTVISAAASGAALTVALVFTPVAGAGEGEMEVLERIHSYIAPPKTLPGFPNAQRAKRKTGRARWINDNGDILEWDSQHGEVEVYDKTGKTHKGAYDPDTGKEKPNSRKPERTTEK